jgi:Ca2+-binding RTX toxin-like protein
VRRDGRAAGEPPRRRLHRGGLQGLRIDRSQAVEPKTPVVGAFDANAPHTRLTVGNSSIPVTVQGGPGREEMLVNSTGPVAVDAGDGDDRLTVASPRATVVGGPGNDRIGVAPGSTVAGRAPWRVDAGPGNDGVEGGAIPDDSIVLGGPGDDRLNFDTENVTGESPVARQRLDCGDGADLAIIDAREVVGPGCGPAPHGVTRRMTLGTFGDTGAIRLAVGRVSRPTRVRIRMTGPAPPGLNSTSPNFQVPYAAIKVLPRITGAVRTTINPVSSVRRRLRTRRAAVRRVVVQMDLSAPGQQTADRTSLFLISTLRRQS